MTGQKVRQQTLAGRLTVMKGSEAPSIVEGHAPAMAVNVGGAASTSETTEAETKVRQRSGVYAH